MKKYLVVYYAPASASETMKNVTPEEMQAGMEPWYAWARSCGESLADLGTPLANGQVMSKAGSSPSDRNIAGYSMLQAADTAAVLALLPGHPHLGWAEGCEIEVHECMPLPG